MDSLPYTHRRPNMSLRIRRYLLLSLFAIVSRESRPRGRSPSRRLARRPRPIAWSRSRATRRAGGGTLSAPTSPPGADGIARIGWTLGSAEGVNTLTASAAGAGSVSFTATAEPGRKGSGQACRTFRMVALPRGVTSKAYASFSFTFPLSV